MATIEYGQMQQYHQDHLDPRTEKYKNVSSFIDVRCYNTSISSFLLLYIESLMLHMWLYFANFNVTRRGHDVKYIQA